MNNEECKRRCDEPRAPHYPHTTHVPHFLKDGKRAVNPIRIQVRGGERKRKSLVDGGRRCPSSSHDQGGGHVPEKTNLCRDVGKKGR